MSAKYWHSTTHIIDASHIREYPHAVSGDQHKPLRLAVKHYQPRQPSRTSSQDVTIIAAHANGVGKEMYEPLWDDLYESLGKTRIKGIWISDCAWQGESGVLNEAILGNDPSWYDTPRDMLHMINTFRSEITQPIIGIGHSMGGNNIVNLSLIHPRLFASVILIDPVIQRTGSAMGSFFPAFSSTFRRDIWPSREEAAKAFRKNPFYRRWDERVMDLWMSHGLRELPTALYPSLPDTKDAILTSTKTPPSTASAIAAVATAPVSAAPVPSAPAKAVTLTTTKHQEVFSFLRSAHPAAGQSLDSHTLTPLEHPDVPETNPVKPFHAPAPIITFSQLPHLRPPCLYIFAERSPLSAPMLRKDKLALTGTGVGGNGGVERGETRSVIVSKAGHFVCFERVGEVAELIRADMKASLEKWQAETDAVKAKWDKRRGREKFTISKDREWWTQALQEGFETGKGVGQQGMKQEPAKGTTKAKL